MLKTIVCLIAVLGFNVPIHGGFNITLNGVSPGPFTSVIEGDYIVSWFAPGAGDQPTAVSVGGNVAIGDSNAGLTNGLVLGAPIRIARVDGAAFDLNSLDVANVGTSPTGSFAFAPRVFTGFDDRFPTTNSSFTTFLTSGTQYKGLTSIGIATLSWQGDAYLLDNFNVQVTSVPEPSSLVLWLGVAAVSCFYKCRTRNSSHLNRLSTNLD